MQADASVSVNLYLAGTLYLTIDEVPITSFHSLKTQAILAYLAVEGHSTALERDDLAAMFWDGYTRKSGRANLRMSLSNLRSLLGKHRDMLVTTRNTVQLKCEEGKLWCDVLHVQRVLENGAAAARQQLQARLKAFDRVLLPEFETLDSPAFIEWLKQKRTQYAAMIDQLRQSSTIARGRLTVKHNLPRSIKTVFGRNKDIRALTTLLESSQQPLISLIGPGGVGKTELALALARQQLDNFPDGVWFVPLDKIQPSNSPEIARKQLAQQIAHTLRMVPRGVGSLQEQLTHYISTRKMLLILDNCEHMLSATPVVFDLLRNAHNLKIVATSRQRLNDFSETVYRVNGLATGNSASAPSIQLFLDRLQRLGIPITDDTQRAAAIQICKMLNGLPLGIELATALCETQTPAQLYAELQSDLTPLTTDMPSVPKRHRSLWTIMAHSWQLLSWEEQRILLQCTVIRGAFSAEIGTLITQASQNTFRTLIQHGFITPTQDNQYTLHPQIRRFCLERSQNNSALHGWLTQAAHRHATTFLEWLVQQAQQLHKSPETTVVIQQQYADIEQAWQWCVSRNLSTLIAKSSQALATCLQTVGRGETGIVWFERALQSQTDPNIVAYLRMALATLHIARHDLMAARNELDILRKLDAPLTPYLNAQRQLLVGHLARQANDRIAAYEAVSGYSADLIHFATSASYHLGEIYAADQAWEAAETVWEKGYQLAIDNNDRLDQARFCQALGRSAYAQTNYTVAWEKFAQGIELAANMPIPDLHHDAALTAFKLKRYDAARNHLLSALPVYHQYQLIRKQTESLLLLSRVEWTLNMNDEAHQTALDALDLAQLSGDSEQIDRAIVLLDLHPNPQPKTAD